MSKVKICGLRTLNDIEAVNQYQPDYAGMILSEPFWRCVDIDTACLLKKHLNPKIQMTGVFVNEDLEYITPFIEKGCIDVIQLHGQEDNAYILEVKKRYPEIPVIKAFKIKEEADIQKAKESKADYVLLDSGTGTGKTFDWKLIKDIGREYFLAGGLTPENVETAIRQFQPYAVDTSSGVETEKKKDADKIREFIRKAREL
ncbi:MAG: phosphoribosylanthranilate isomerase [Solobacterium sp.]|nr:phosphoribosylanthranilate isomerase [Solobacterium sp.]